jgi:hypothetical protein
MPLSAGRRNARDSSASPIVMMAKKKMTPAQLAALAALEKFESQLATGAAPAAEGVSADLMPSEPPGKDKKKKDKAKGNQMQGGADSEDGEDGAQDISGQGGPMQGAQDKKNKRGKKGDFDMGDDTDYGSDAEEEAVVEIPKAKSAPAPPAPEEVSMESDDEFDFSNKGKKDKKDKNKGKAAAEPAQASNSKKKVEKAYSRLKFLGRVYNQIAGNSTHVYYEFFRMRVSRIMHSSCRVVASNSHARFYSDLSLFARRRLLQRWMICFSMRTMVGVPEERTRRRTRKKTRREAKKKMMSPWK